jgi:hypothetical protein
LTLTITTPSITIVPSTHSCNSVNIGGPHTTHNVEKFLDLQISSRICRGGDGNTPSAIGREVQRDKDPVRPRTQQPANEGLIAKLSSTAPVINRVPTGRPTRGFEYSSVYPEMM